ncbi:hypothetical protein GGI43DRAFT_417978 [Trichoderma evansii]
MNDIEEKTRQTEFYHIFPATSVVAAIAVKRLRQIVTDAKDIVTAQYLHYKTFELAHVSIRHFMEARQCLIQTDLPYQERHTNATRNMLKRTNRKMMDNTNRQKLAKQFRLMATREPAILQTLCLNVNNLMQCSQWREPRRHPRKWS